MKTHCLLTNWIRHYLGKEKFEKLDEERKVLALIKSLIYMRERKEALGHAMKDQSKWIKNLG